MHKCKLFICRSEKQHRDLEDQNRKWRQMEVKFIQVEEKKKSQVAPTLCLEIPRLNLKI